MRRPTESGTDGCVGVHRGDRRADIPPVLAWVAVLLATAGVGVSVRWWLTRVDALGRGRPFPAIGVTVCSVGAIGCVLPVLLQARLEHRLAAAASVVAGRRVEVHCQTLGQAWVDARPELGYVELGRDGRPQARTVMAVQACDDLSDWLGSGQREPTRDQIVAVHVLTHEAMHMAGETDEARAECRAVQRDAHLARLLGDSPERARALARRYWREVYPHLPDAYRSVGCRPGAVLDEHLPEAPW